MSQTIQLSWRSLQFQVGSPLYISQFGLLLQSIDWYQNWVLTETAWKYRHAKGTAASRLSTSLSLQSDIVKQFLLVDLQWSTRIGIKRRPAKKDYKTPVLIIPNNSNLRSWRLFCQFRKIPRLPVSQSNISVSDFTHWSHDHWLLEAGCASVKAPLNLSQLIFQRVAS